GIQADLKTFSALGCYGASAITAITAQNTLGVSAIHDCPPDIVRAQINDVLSDLDVKAIKIGMLSRVETIVAVAECLKAYPHIPVVLDPVMVATSGDALLAPEAERAIVEHLFPLALLITPNLAEAARLTGTPIAETEEDRIAQADQLAQMGAPHILIKGGHGNDAEAVDLLFRGEEITKFASPRIDTKNTHGTGCTLSSAIAANIAMGLDIIEAVQNAKDYVYGAIEASDRLAVGRGNGPTHHFYQWW
ncbi:MAG: bifunctional hydroxymethylpyrimidine kinase/phosphomethylpyrimidine kinase, partial [Pseudomonadota bacterium]